MTNEIALIKMREYYQKNKDKIRVKHREWARANKDKVKKYRRAYYAKNREKIIKKAREYYFKDRELSVRRGVDFNRRYRQRPEVMVRIRLRSRVAEALKSQNIKKTKAFNEYGIDVEGIKRKLGNPPTDEKDWHIDHIVPLQYFNLSDPEEIKKAFAPENHQWLKARDNISKGNKMRLKI